MSRAAEARQGARVPHGRVSYLPPPHPARLPIHTCTNPLGSPPPAERILIIRLGAVGDVVRTLPAASVLRAAYADAHLAWLVEPPSRSLLESLSWLDEVIVFPRPELRAALLGARGMRLGGGVARFVRELREHRFDLVVDFHSILKSAALAWASGSPRRVGYAPPFAREGAHRFATDRVQLAPRRQSRFRRNEAMVRYLGLEEPPARRPLAIAAEQVEAAAKALGPGPPPVAIHPGTSDATPYKRWTVEGYAAVARALAEQGVPSVVTCGPARDDRLFAERLIDQAGGAARLAPPTPTLPDLAALFQACRLYLGGDTGPLHLASLVGTPVVQLIGPTDPVENEPYPHTPSRTVRVQIHCNPCRRGCAAASCMKALSAAAVLAAVRELLAAESGLR